MQNFTVILKLEYGHYRKDTMASQWADDLVRKKNEREEARQIEDQRVVSDRSIVTNNSPQKWQKICQLLEDGVADLNQANGSKVLYLESTATQVDIKIVSLPNSTNLIKFDGKNHRLKVPFHGCELQLSISQLSELFWKSTCSETDRWTDEAVAKKSIEYAWSSLMR